MAKNSIAKKHPIAGFTLIELLVTIVIIGILVGIGVVSYNGIMKQNRQKDLENSLIDAAGKVQNYISKNNKLPSGLSDVGVENSGGVTYIFKKGEFPKFCIEGVRSGSTFSITNSASAVTDGSCTFMSGGDIQTATKSNCPATRTIVVDQRDRKTYYIQKLGNDCWMLTNLAYAGGTANGGTNTYNDVIAQGAGTPGTPKGTLSNGTADSSTTYTEAKYYIPTGANPTTDPTEPSTLINGTGQYGYLYNWCAAMGGQDTAACKQAVTPAPIPTTNICPAGWRLPTGEPTTGEFTALNTAINGGRTGTDAGLIASPGLFQRSGSWYNGFNNQGSYGDYWSSTQLSATYAHNLDFRSAVVYPEYNNNKNCGFAVRCVAE